MSEAWTRKEGKNPKGGLNEKGRKSYEAANPGSDLKAPQPKGGPRKKSFCARMGGMKKKLTSSKTANDPNSRINKSLRAWKCKDGGAVRDYKDEYKKFQDSPAQKKKRAALNRENHKRGTYGNGDGLDVSHTKNGIKLEKSSINKGRKEKSRMVGSKRKKQKGGYLSGPSHDNGGIPAVVAGKQPVELEGGEYIIRKSSVDKLGKGVLEEINKKGRIPTMTKGGKVSSTKSKMKTEKPIVYKSKDEDKPKKKGSLWDRMWTNNPQRQRRLKKQAEKNKNKAVVGKEGKRQLTDDADRWTLGENLTKKGRKKGKQRRSAKRAIKTLQGLDESKVTTTIKGPDKIKQTKQALKKSGKIKKKDVKGAVVTKGGMYPEYGKKTKSAGNFRDAFKAARKAGKKTFEWQGRKYTSQTAEEAKAAKETKVKDTGTPVAQMGGFMPRPHKTPIRTYKYGGQVSTSNNKAGCGDIHTVHTHSGYKAGE